MRKTGIAMLVIFSLVLAGCGRGSSSASGNINGNWSASLMDTNGTVVYQFAATFTESMNGGLTITNFNFRTPGPCFASYSSPEYTENGSFTLSGNFNGKVTGTLQFTVTTMFPATNNVLTLQGNVNGNTISGTWMASGGSGCSGSGTFTLQPAMA